jgi:hypothetical protein
MNNYIKVTARESDGALFDFALVAFDDACPKDTERAVTRAADLTAEWRLDGLSVSSSVYRAGAVDYPQIGEAQ